MELPLSFLMWSCIIIVTAFLLHARLKFTSLRLPPGPPGWPLVGHLFNLGTMPHRTMAGLKQKYGPILWLRLGSGNTMVILTAKAAAEFFKNYDLSFANRPISETTKSHDYYKGSLAMAPYGEKWRMLRRIVTVEILTNRRIKESAPLRQKCIDDLLNWIQNEAEMVKEGQGIEVGRFLFLALYNMIGNLALSRDLADPKSEMASEFFSSIKRLIQWAGTANISDLFPSLKRFDFQGLRRKMDHDKGKALEIVSGFVKERIKMRQEGGGERNKDFLDVLLGFEGSGKNEPKKLLEKDITVLLLEILMAGSETSSSTIEWALTELLINPETMVKVKAELTMIIGPKRKLEEDDIDNLPYLQAVIKETLRLHAPLPFLLPRLATQNTKCMGYDIPKETQVLVNTWAIGRDPECWEDPLSFKPERFLGSDIDYRGLHYELIPFGAGRRMCPGIPLVGRMMPLLLGSLLHGFDWKFGGNFTPETIDMNEKMGMTMRKMEPLLAIPKKI